VNTSLTRECLELILLLGDAMDKKKARPPITVSQNSLPVTSQTVLVQPRGSEDAGSSSRLMYRSDAPRLVSE
jgi:hypothetical protein